MAKPNSDERRAVKNMRSTVQTLSEMLTHTVAEAHRLQRQQEKALGRHFENQQELLESYDTKTMKELTAVLKDITAVAKALEESSAEQEAAATGIVLLPTVTLPEQGCEQEKSSDAPEQAMPDSTARIAP